MLDGAIGTEILRRDVTWADHQLQKRPEVVRAIHADYLAAGADVISTNTFQLTRRAFRTTSRTRRTCAASARRPRDALGGPAASRRSAWPRRRAPPPGSNGRSRHRRRHDHPRMVLPTRPGADTGARPRRVPRDRAGLQDAGADLLLIETVNSVARRRAAREAARTVGIPFWIAFVPTSMASCSAARHSPTPRPRWRPRPGRRAGELRAARGRRGWPGRAAAALVGAGRHLSAYRSLRPARVAVHRRVPARRATSNKRCEWKRDGRDRHRRLLWHDARHIARAGERAVIGQYDAIVVGGGHNGLVTAAYLATRRLARAGARTTRRWSAARASPRKSSRATASRPRPTWSACSRSGSCATSTCAASATRCCPKTRPISRRCSTGGTCSCTPTCAARARRSRASRRSDAERYPAYEASIERVARFVEPMLLEAAAQPAAVAAARLARPEPPRRARACACGRRSSAS